MRFGVPPLGPDVRAWANDMRRWLAAGWDVLTYKDASAKAVSDGVLLWDPAGYPVVSREGEWRQLIMADGYAAARVQSSITAASADTAYAIKWDPLQFYEGVSIVDDTKITFEKPGFFFYGFSTTIKSSTGSDVTFHFWPRVNGTDVPFSNIRHTLHTNGAEATIGRSGLFNVSAGDYIESMWAVSSTSGRLEAAAATSFSPASPSASISITRVRA